MRREIILRGRGETCCRGGADGVKVTVCGCIDVRWDFGTAWQEPLRVDARLYVVSSSQECKQAVKLHVVLRGLT